MVAAAEAGGAGDRQEWRIMVAAAEAGGAGDWQDWQLKEELKAEEEEVNELKEPFAGFVKEPFAGFVKEPFTGFVKEPFAGFVKEPFAGIVKEPFAVFVTYAPPDVSTGTKFNVRTGNKLSPLVLHNSGQFGIKENYKTANSWRSPRTDPPTELQF